MKLLIVIVNYRSADLAIDCLRSLAPQLADPSQFKVVVTDNLSPDDSIDKLRAKIQAENWSAWVDLRPLEKNNGFAYGNNEGIKPYLDSNDKPQYVMLLNPDTIVRPGAIGALLKFMDENPRVGICGPRLEELDGTPQRSAFRFPSVSSEFENGMRIGLVSRLLKNSIVAPEVQNETHRTDWVSGACMVFRREVFQTVGLLDEGYFMYYEEVDLCLRASRAGFECWYVPQAHVVHLIGQSSDATAQRKPSKRRPAYWFESRKRYFRKNHGFIVEKLSSILWAFGFGMFRIRQMLTGHPTNDPPALFTDFVRRSIFSL